MMLTLHNWVKGTAFVLVLSSIATAIATEEAVRPPVEASSSARQLNDRGRYLVKNRRLQRLPHPWLCSNGGKIPRNTGLSVIV